MESWIYSAFHNSPRAGFWFVVGCFFVLGALLGVGISYCVHRIRWRQWLPLKHWRKLTELQAQLKIALHERAFYKYRYGRTKSALNAIGAILGENKQDEEQKHAKPVRRPV